MDEGHLLGLQGRLECSRVVAPTREEHQAVLILELLGQLTHRGVQHEGVAHLAGELTCRGTAVKGRDEAQATRCAGKQQ